VAVVDPRTLAPFDDATVVESLRRTHRLVVVQEGSAAGSWGASLVARMAQEHFTLLDAPPLVVCSDDTPVPYSGVLEDAWLPSVERIVREVEEVARW
jgi:pyruvate dehydrogenase E1 component beta subunit